MRDNMDNKKCLCNEGCIHTDMCKYKEDYSEIAQQLGMIFSDIPLEKRKNLRFQIPRCILS